MSDDKCCCNCLHCARWKKSTGIECHCDLDDEYLGYLTVMDTDRNCDKWEKETKWDIQAEHDKQIREEMIDKCINHISELMQEVEKDMLKGNYDSVIYSTLSAVKGDLELMRGGEE